MTTDHDARDIKAANIALAKFPFTGRVSRNHNLALECARIGRLMAEGKWPEVDPDLVEARECAALVEEAEGFDGAASDTRKGFNDDESEVKSALLAIKRTRATLDGGRS